MMLRLSLHIPSAQPQAPSGAMQRMRRESTAAAAGEKVSGRASASLRSVDHFFESSNQHNTRIVTQPNSMVVSGLAARSQTFGVNGSLAVQIAIDLQLTSRAHDQAVI
jgi:hypothetical protein